MALSSRPTPATASRSASNAFHATASAVLSHTHIELAKRQNVCLCQMLQPCPAVHARQHDSSNRLAMCVTTCTSPSSVNAKVEQVHGAQATWPSICVLPIQANSQDARVLLQVMYAEPMGSKTPNSRSPQSAMRMEHPTPSEDGEEVLQPSPPVPGNPVLCAVYPVQSPIRSLYTQSW